MALVSYENSDSSEYEEDDKNTTTLIITNKKNEAESIAQPSRDKPVIENGHETEDTVLNDKSIFNLLPQPSSKKFAVIEEDDEFLHKKETVSIVKPKAKITVPLLSDFKDVEDSVSNSKPKTVNGKKSGLLSILPRPRNAVTVTTTSKTLMPDILRQKANNATIQKLNSINKKTDPAPPVKKVKTESLAIDYSDDSDNDDEVQNDFFSINKPVEDLPLDNNEERIKNLQISLSCNQENIQKTQEYFKEGTGQNYVELQPDYVESSSAQCYETAGSSNGIDNEIMNRTNDLPLDEEAILKLVGARGKRKREDIQIVDVNQEEVLADARQWLLKGLMDDTSKRVSSSKRKGNEPTSQQRRKHQITYLAHQAKANEAELQNQWANNRMSKRQTQSKYGF